MSTDNKTLADAQPGGRVRLGDGLRSELLQQAERLERTAAQDRETGESIEQALEAGEEYTPDDAPDVAAGLQHDANRSEEIAALLRKAAAALSAHPSPGGQIALETARELLAAEFDKNEVTAAAARRLRNHNETAVEAAALRVIAARQPSKQPDSVALGEATEFCIEKGARQPVGEPIAFVSSDMLVSLLKVRSHNWMPEVWALPNGTDSVPLYAALPAQQPAQVYLDGLDRAFGEAIDQRDRYHEVADDLAGHIAAITGVDIGEHSSANCPWQNAIEAAEEYKPAQAVDMGEIREMLVGWKNSDYPLSYEGQCAQRALDACVADLQGWLDSQAVGK